MPTPSPARTPLWIFIACSAGGGCAALPIAAVRARSPDAAYPLGSMQAVYPARMRVLVLIAVSFPGVGTLLPVGIDAAGVSGAELSRNAHRCSFSRWGLRSHRRPRGRS
jgi:hypothetical protein